MKILVVGSGGREHALCWKIAQSPLCDVLYCAPGNAGIAEVAHLVPIGAEDLEALVYFAQHEAIDLVVIGPEAPLVAGLADQLRAREVPVFGPGRAAAALEASKGFMKDLLAKAGVPTAWYGRFTDADTAKAFAKEKTAAGDGRIVVKADGLAAGKGVILCASLSEAEAAIDHIMVDRAFGAAGAEVVLEEFLDGEEASFFALVDGSVALPLAAAQDHKAVGEGDTGPNTGGMGAYSPAPIVDAAMQDRIMAEVVDPVVKAMAEAGAPFSGVLFGGLMIQDGVPKVLEFNVRFGDPECQVLMSRLTSDLVPVLKAAASGPGGLEGMSLDWSDAAAMVVVMAAKGYPGSYAKGSVIGGLDQANGQPGAIVFHAGTKNSDAEPPAVLANGGRVLGVTATGATVREARDRAYGAVDALDWPDGFCRRDIGYRALAREEG